MTDGVFLEDRFRYDCTGTWFKGSVHIHTTNGSGRLTLTEDWVFARLEIEDQNGKIAWSNPLLIGKS